MKRKVWIFLQWWPSAPPRSKLPWAPILSTRIAGTPTPSTAATVTPSQLICNWPASTLVKVVIVTTLQAKTKLSECIVSALNITFQEHDMCAIDLKIPYQWRNHCSERDQSTFSWSWTGLVAWHANDMSSKCSRTMCLCMISNRLCRQELKHFRLQKRSCNRLIAFPYHQRMNDSDWIYTGDNQLCE